ncbi:MAG: inorganic phosphate transporter [Chthoniobacteraceae bacterium]
MIHLAIASPDFFTGFFLVVAIGLALAFEFVNGFHDTANAVATVIYTNTLKPNIAVIWSGIWNLIGVLTSKGLVAFSIVALLPVELVLHVGSGAGFAMVFSLLVSAIIWNLGTWYLGLPASSSHTLIGSIIGVGVANAAMSGHKLSEGVNWGKVQEVGLTLLASPIFGFFCAAILLYVLKALIKNRQLFDAPEKDKAPPMWIRCILFLTCTGVSFFHGSNDGQKGQGLLVLILVGILPGMYALKMDENPDRVQKIVAEAKGASDIFTKHAEGAIVDAKDVEKELASFVKTGKVSGQTYAALATASSDANQKLSAVSTFSDLSEADRIALRTDLYLSAAAIGRLDKGNLITDSAEKSSLKDYAGNLNGVTKYIPLWVKCAVALALGLGTMIGWKRIVVTVGEKIGKSHLNYAQGASAEIVAMSTIGLADGLGLPVSTTHVLSSGVAGAMFANKSGLQMETLRNLLLAWVLTLPVCVFLGSMLFAFGNLLVLNHVFGLK